MFLILTGKTASGKDTIKFQLLKNYPNLKKVLTTTSRAPRDGEQKEVDYHFLSREEFEDKIRSDEFAEYVEYGGNLYGTYKKELEQALNSDILWKIDPSRAGEAREFIKRAFPNPLADELNEKLKVIYINTQDEVVLERLQKRGLNPGEIEKRMADDKRIWAEYGQNYDFVVENTPGKLEETLKKVTQIIEKQ